MYRTGYIHFNIGCYGCIGHSVFTSPDLYAYFQYNTVCTQAGLAGDDAPTAVFPTLVGRPRHRVCMYVHVCLYIILVMCDTPETLYLNHGIV